MEEPNHSPSSSSSASVHSHSPAAATSSSSASHVREEEDGGEQYHRFPHPELEQQQISTSSPRRFGTFNDGTQTMIREDTWSCVVVILTFWFFVSMTLILGVYGSVNLQLGPNCSHLFQPNPIFVQSIKFEELNESKSGPMLYGFYSSPPLDTFTMWSERHNLSIPTDSHKEWIYFLNAGSEINVSYSVNSSTSSIFLIVADGYEGLTQWLQDPTYPNTTLSWNVIHGSGVIRQSILKSSSYYVAVGNLNSENVEVQLNLSIKAFLYNTTEAYYKCTFTQGSCSMKILFPEGNAAVLTSPGLEKGGSVDEWNLKLYYGPRWATYIVGIGVMTALMLLIFNFFNEFQCIREDRIGSQYEVARPERTPLLSNKDDDLSSWGSSYDSVSNDEDDLEDFLGVGSHEGKILGDGDKSNSTRRLCAICFDAPRDCFFLPCGHCVACFACGTRIAEVDGTCPICRRSLKKVRKIFTV
ncbi:hypothetical protein FNV43_RR10277 [Rhamnella rubrinervis]|uniref:RING-type domain-containing protein n=1 Tax=Rhamnella rubrinervis TaxID=2594499 RepID=A0A8K0HCX8_9ROSA|nr:hypothetical protein FNV43_RR10277 [Rhamnella rubrinervis]